MLESLSEARVLLIGGTSNVGKSTFAWALADRLGWSLTSTDSLARHPGRPWRTAPEEVPAHVASYYLTYSPDELIDDVLLHYQRLWDRIEALIILHAGDSSTEKLILEGSALWPASVATLKLDHVQAVWLTASDELLRQRIYTSSRFNELTADKRELIEKFLARTLQFNAKMMDEIERLGLPVLEVKDTYSFDQLFKSLSESLHDKMN